MLPLYKLRNREPYKWDAELRALAKEVADIIEKNERDDRVAYLLSNHIITIDQMK